MILDYVLEIIKYILVSSVVLEVVPIKINPIQFILKWAGQSLNKNVEEKIESLDERLLAIENKVIQNDLKLIRSTILDFANSLRNSRRHTIEEFNHIIELIDEYHLLCEKNNITNGVIDVQSQYIRETYNRLSHDGKLKDKKETGELL